jgi:predicted dehydrogenase
MTVRVGLVGPGEWGRLILRDLKALGAEVWTVARSPASVENARRFGADRIVPGIEALPIDLDGYVVATPAETHLDVVEPLLRRGRPIFVEKPLDVDVARARALPPSAQSLVFTMHKWRYQAGVERLAAMARAGELGPILGLDLVRVGFGQTSARKVGGIWSLVPHDLSIALHILGEVPRPVWASPGALDRRGDGVVAVLQTQSGMRVTLNASMFTPLKRRSVVLAGELGAAQLDDPLADHLLVAWEDGRTERIGVPQTMPLLIQLECFVKHLRGGPPPMTRLSEELQILEALEQLHHMAGLA